jgi:osmotically-inducible protein OsmY
MRSPVAFIAGAGMAYLFDPQSGKGRRHELRNRLLALLRRSGRRAVGKAKYVAGHAEGIGAEAVGVVTKREDQADDQTVKDRILSQAFRDVGVSTGEVSVDVADGIATLRGTPASAELAQALIERVRAVPGVRTVTPRLTVSRVE